MSDNDGRFTFRLWRKIQEALGTKLTFSVTFNLQTEGQLKRIIHTLEDLLRLYTLDFGGN